MPQRPLSRWRERLERLDARLRDAPDPPWRLRVERRVLAFFLRRHRGDDPRRAEGLDPPSAEQARRMRLSPDARERLRPAGDSRVRASRGFRGQGELAELDDAARRQADYRAYLDRRSRLLILFFFIFAIFTASAAFIIRYLN
ncbi:MAG: hypothetical protein M5U26_01735 [Planctomycetota bacterium]|nr:hypothetical protein [Planctomycetota bacterium]